MKTNNLKSTFGIAPNHTRTDAAAPRPSRKVSKKINPPTTPERLTEVSAKIDVGFGNALFIRGQGNGLSWDKGTPLTCQNASTWVWSTPRAEEKLVFKLLLNDIVWSRGQDLVLEAGKQIEVAPVF